MKKAAPILAICLPVLGQESAAWPDKYVARLEALAPMETLPADLLTPHSSTLTLEAWRAPS